MVVGASAVAILLTATSGALAHPGHSMDSGTVGLLHFVLEASHGGRVLSALLAATVLAAVAGTLARTRSRR